MYVEVMRWEEYGQYTIDKLVGCCEAFRNAVHDQRSIVFYDQHGCNYDAKFKLVSYPQYYKKRKEEADFQMDYMKDLVLVPISHCPFCGSEIQIEIYG